MANENADLEQDKIEEEETTEEETPEESEELDYKALYEQERREKKKLKRQLYSKKADEVPSTITSSSDVKWKEKMELKVEGYDDGEADYIIKNGGRKALETSPFLKKTIEVMREQKKAENALIGDDTSKSPTEKRLSPEAFSKLSAAEQVKALSDIR